MIIKAIKGFLAARDRAAAEYQRGWQLAYDETTGWLNANLTLKEIEKLMADSEHTALWSKAHSNFYRGKYDAIQDIKVLTKFLQEA